MHQTWSQKPAPPSAPDTETHLPPRPQDPELTHTQEWNSNTLGSLSRLAILPKGNQEVPLNHPMFERIVFLQDWFPEIYTGIEFIGAGSSGLVFQVRNRETAAKLAIKLLHNPSPERRESFIEESRITALVGRKDQGDGTLRVSEMGKVTYRLDRHDGESVLVQDGSYLPMELLADGSLRDQTKILRSSHITPPLFYDRVTELFSKRLVQVCGALQVTHELGFVHRDLKPDNILCDGPRTRIADFGLATRLRQSEVNFPIANLPESFYAGLGEERRERMCGTPRYMSPEHVDPSLPIDPRSDIYSLGIIMYEILTGRNIYEGLNSVKEIQAFHERNEEIKPAFRTEDKRIPPELSRITEKALQRSLSRRYQTTSELQRDLKNFGHLAKAHWQPSFPSFDDYYI